VAEQATCAVGRELEPSLCVEEADVLAERVKTLLERGEHRGACAPEIGVAVGLHQVRAPERE
jgi:hypothetical protein